MGTYPVKQDITTVQNTVAPCPKISHHEQVRNCNMTVVPRSKGHDKDDESDTVCGLYICQNASRVRRYDNWLELQIKNKPTCSALHTQTQNTPARWKHTNHMENDMQAYIHTKTMFVFITYGQEKLYCYYRSYRKNL